MIAFLKIYDHLYHTNQFDKALVYGKEISYYQNKKINYKNYGPVVFEKVQSNGMLMIKEKRYQIYNEYLLDIEEDEIC